MAASGSRAPDVVTATRINSQPLLSGSFCEAHEVAGKLSNRPHEARAVELTAVEPSGTEVQGSDAACSPDVAKLLCRRNIRAMFAFQLLSALAWGTAMGPVFDRYLYLLGSGGARDPQLLPIHGANSLVGLAESISGITSLVMAIPVGILVDRHPDRRARLLRASALVGLTAALVGLLAVLMDEVLLLTLMLVLFGAFSELSSSASEAIFADSIPAGERSGLFVTKAIFSTVGAACGPFISALGLLFLGDVWQPHQMKAVIISGVLITAPAVATLFFFRDPPPVDPLKEASPQSAALEDSGPAAEVPRGELRFGPLSAKHVPVLISVSDFITCIGAGMTVKFFNLFFIQDHGFSPVAISLLQTGYPLVIAVFMKFTQRLAKPFGRAQASLLFFSLNVLCLVVLGEVTWLPILLCVFLLRGGFANSTYPLDRSILMDFTPSSQRGMWNSIASLTSMTWSGSAFIGGFISDAHDYRFTFLITALLYGIACVVYVPLVKLVPRKEQDAASSGQR
ncbi:unnamed protein product [Polarella glacialis]|uniref:Major facilitator superfamily (MFS) profile domain-containing protein n=1 Tax=Polarella glacialis TaxID=89957 RepID=A0A813DXH5_POLGL|nr:unnamed protein product [Polarella glacialis]